MRIAILGNAGSGKSTLAAKLSAEFGLPLCEVDRFMWKEGWLPAYDEEFRVAHEAVLAKKTWVIDGMGRKGSLQQRIDRATHVVFCDFPIWQNFWLLAERQARWRDGGIALPPGGQKEPPPTRDLFEFVWKVETEFMPDVREMVRKAEARKIVQRVSSFDELNQFQLCEA